MFPTQPKAISAPTIATASLELKAEKQNAHAKDMLGHGSINAVQFSPDGSTVVSCGNDQTIKVWDAGIYLSPQYSSPSPKLSAPMLATASLELMAEKESAHSD